MRSGRELDLVPDHVEVLRTGPTIAGLVRVADQNDVKQDVETSVEKNVENNVVVQ